MSKTRGTLIKFLIAILAVYLTAFLAIVAAEGVVRAVVGSPDVRAVVREGAMSIKSEAVALMHNDLPRTACSQGIAK